MHRTDSSKLSLKFKKKGDSVPLPPELVLSLRQQIAGVKEQNRLLSGKLNSAVKYRNRLGRTLSLIERNCYVSNGPKKNQIERVLCEKSKQVLMMQQETFQLEQQRQSIRKEIQSLKANIQTAPKKIKTLEQILMRKQANLYLLAHIAQFRSKNSEEVLLLEQSFKGEQRRLLTQNQRLKKSIERAKSMLNLVCVQSQSIKPRAKKDSKNQDKDNKQTTSLFMDNTLFEQENQREMEQTMIHAQAVIEQAVLEKLQKKREIIMQVDELKLLQKEWLDLLKEIQRK